MGTDYGAVWSELDRSLTSIESVLDPDAKKAEIAELETEVARPDLWDDQENAQRVTSRLSALQGELERVEKLRSRLDDVQVLVELAQSENDADSLAEADRELAGLKRSIDSL
jgi:peptide chain release factor 2